MEKAIRIDGKFCKEYIEKENMKTIPKLLYKFKMYDNKPNHKKYVKEILLENKLYLSPHSKLNDPLEGAGHNINIKGWAGMSIPYYADEELGPIEQIKEQYRILSLSEEASSPLLWAYYADNYKGVCFCFSTNGSLGAAKRIKYSRYYKEKHPSSDFQLDKDVYYSFFQKQTEWKYEKEWRIVKLRKEEKDYLYFDSKELVGIIIGDKMDEKLQRELRKLTPNHVKILRTKIGYQKPAVKFLPIDYEYEYDGSPIMYVDNLEKYLLS